MNKFIRFNTKENNKIQFEITRLGIKTILLIVSIVTFLDKTINCFMVAVVVLLLMVIADFLDAVL